jgi:hypothetical protein
VRLFGESDAIERQLAATAREGAMLARVAHACAFLMLALFSAGSLVALAGDSIQAIASGHATFPAIIAAAVSGLLVACMDTAMLYAASILRLLASRRAAKEEGRLHRWVLGSVAILEAATYGYMSWRYEHPADSIAWGLIIARALAAPLLSVYLSLARPLPVTARDMLAVAERIAGEGVLRDLARIASDMSAPLADKVSLYIAAAVIASPDRTRLEALLAVAQRREAETRIAAVSDADAASTMPSAIAPSQQVSMRGMPPDDAPDRPPTGPGSPVRTRHQDGEQTVAPVIQLPRKRGTRRTAGQGRARGTHPSRVRTVRTATVEAKARAAWQPSMSVGQLERAASISRSAAGKWRKVLIAEATQAAQRDQAAQ